MVTWWHGVFPANIQKLCVIANFTCFIGTENGDPIIYIIRWSIKATVIYNSMVPVSRSDLRSQRNSGSLLTVQTKQCFNVKCVRVQSSLRRWGSSSGRRCFCAASRLDPGDQCKYTWSSPTRSSPCGCTARSYRTRFRPWTWSATTDKKKGKNLMNITLKLWHH